MQRQDIRSDTCRDGAEGLSHPRYAQLVTRLSHALVRLNTALRPSPPLELMDLPYLADMCGFDSQTRGTEWKGWSDWCGIFSSKEWEALGYLRDAERFYHVGGGSVSCPQSMSAVLSGYTGTPAASAETARRLPVRHQSGAGEKGSMDTLSAFIFPFCARMFPS